MLIGMLTASIVPLPSKAVMSILSSSSWACLRDSEPLLPTAVSHPTEEAGGTNMRRRGKFLASTANESFGGKKKARARIESAIVSKQGLIPPNQVLKMMAKRINDS
jgi:hypothetical protein